jgi:hypothetical protein
MTVMAKRINVSYRILGTYVTLLYVGMTSENNSSGSLIITNQMKVKFRFRAPAIPPEHILRKQNEYKKRCTLRYKICRSTWTGFHVFHILVLARSLCY